ncbi:hypothetical protein HID58_034210, partial [Brassica napus]
AETREVCSSSTIPLRHHRSNFPHFTVTPTLTETMQKQLHLQAWNPPACNYLSSSSLRKCFTFMAIIMYLMEFRFCYDHLFAILFLLLESMFRGVFSVPRILMRRRLALRLRVPDLYPPEDEAHGGAREVDRLRRGRDREAVCVQRASVCVGGDEPGKRTSSRRELVTTRKLLLCLALMEAARLIIIETHGYVLLPNCEALLVLSSLKVALYVGDWMGIFNGNGTRHTRTVKNEEDSLKCDGINETGGAWDELCQMVPDSWKVEITETIDLDLLSQLLNSGTLDIDYLGKMLEFALATLRKLSAPANDRENESTHQSCVKLESGSLHAVAIVKGIRFILKCVMQRKCDGINETGGAWDELCQMVPDSWKVEITETIDLDLLSQLLNSGTLDIDYLGKMLEFALATLRKLSAPANDRDNESTHQSCVKLESGSLHAVAIVKGIRFILEQIHVCIRNTYVNYFR